MYFDTDEQELVWDDDTKTVSLNLRLKTATALVAVGLLVASPANAQVVVGRGGNGPDVQISAPPRSGLPPEWLRHIPKATGNAPYQPSRGKPPTAAAPSRTTAPIAPNYTAPKPLPIAPSPSYNQGAMQAPQLKGATRSTAFDAYQKAPAAKADDGLMAAPWSPRSQHTDRPLFPELQPKAPPARAAAGNTGGAVLAAPQLAGKHANAPRDGNTTLPPVLTPDLMSSLQQAARDEDFGEPPVPVGLIEGNGVNASSAQDRIQSLGTIERSRVDAIVAEREGREGAPSSRRLFSQDDAPRDVPTRSRDSDIPVPPAPPAPTPVPSSMGYLPTPRGREDEVAVPRKPYASDSLAPLEQAAADKPDEVTIRVDDDIVDAPKDTSGRRVLGRVGDTQKPTVYNTPTPVPMDNITVPAAPATPDEPLDDKAFKAEGRKLFTAKKKIKKDAAAEPQKQMSLFDEAQKGAVTASDGSQILKLPEAPVEPKTEKAAKNILTLSRDEAGNTARAIESEGKAAADTATTVAADGAKEIKEVPVNRTPFGDNVLSTITPDGATSEEAAAAAVVATDAAGVPDITMAQEAPKVLGKGPRTRTTKKVAAPKVESPKVEEPREEPKADIVEAPAKPAPEPKAATPAEDEIRVVVDDEPAAPAVVEQPKNVLRAPVAAPIVAERPAPRAAAPLATEAYVPPKAALRREYRDNSEQVLRAPADAAPVAAPVDRTPTSLKPIVDTPPPPVDAPRVQQEQIYVQTPAAPAEGERPRLRTPKLLLGSELPAAAPAPARTVAEITPEPEPVIEPTVIERPNLTPPPEAQIDPVVIAPPPAEVQLRMPTITFGPTERDLDNEGEAQTDMLAEQMGANPGRRLTLIAYAQAPNLNESRRIALSRALAIRSRLAEYGIQPIRVSIRAMGMLSPGDRGTPDRVDTIIQ